MINSLKQQLDCVFIVEEALEKPALDSRRCLRKNNNFDYSVMSNERAVQKFEIYSSYSNVVSVIDDIMTDVRKSGFCPDELMIDIFLVLSELIINAIEHGNNFDTSRMVSIEYIIRPDRCCFSIKDEGCGYDYKSIIFSQQLQGLVFVKFIASNICWNEIGNKVFVCFDFN